MLLVMTPSFQWAILMMRWRWAPLQAWEEPEPLNRVQAEWKVVRAAGEALAIAGQHDAAAATFEAVTAADGEAFA